MDEEMEAELTEMDSKNDHIAVTEEANADEAIPIDIRKERSTQAYIETESTEIEKINSF